MEQKSLSPETRRQLIIAQRNEITEHHIYARLAKSTKDTANSAVLNKIAADELNHYHIWKSYTGRDVNPDYWHIRKFYWISRIFGLTFGVNDGKGRRKGSGKLFENER
jgi:rubrerythrin